VLNDESNEVGSVHLGLVYAVDADDARFNINEPEKMDGRWASADELKSMTGAMETWSRMLMERLI